MLDKLLTIVVATHNSMAILPLFLERLADSLGGEKCSIIICDNGSRDGIKSYLEHNHRNVRLLNLEKNIGYGSALNLGIRAANTNFVALMNSDVFVEPFGFQKLVQFLLEHPDAAGVSGIVAHQAGRTADFSLRPHFPDGKIPVHKKYETLLSRILYYSGLQTKFPKCRLFVPWNKVAVNDSIEVSRLNGCFGIFRKKALLEINLYDPKFFLYFEEDDIALRLKRLKYKLYLTSRAIILHVRGSGSGLSGTRFTAKALLNSQYLFFKKHYGWLYAWVSFIVIWVLIGMVIYCRYPVKGIADKNLLALWQWHLKYLTKSKDNIEEGIAGEESVGAIYNWSKNR